MLKEKIQAHIDKIKNELLLLGPMRPGNLSQQYTACQKPGCKCVDPILWLAIIPYIRRINNLRDCLHCAHFVKILGCLHAFDICSAGFFPSFALGMTSSSRTSPCANNSWLFTPNGPAHGSAPSTNCFGSFSAEYGLDGRDH